MERKNRFWIKDCTDADHLRVGDSVICEIEQEDPEDYCLEEEGYGGPRLSVMLTKSDFLDIPFDELAQKIIDAFPTHVILNILCVKKNKSGWVDILVGFDCLDEDCNVVRTLNDYNNGINRFWVKREYHQGAALCGKKLEVMNLATCDDNYVTCMCPTEHVSYNSTNYYGRISFVPKTMENINTLTPELIDRIRKATNGGKCTLHIVESASDNSGYVVSFDCLDDNCCVVNGDGTNPTVPLMIATHLDASARNVNTDVFICEMIKFTESGSKEHIVNAIRHVPASDSQYQILADLMLEHVARGTQSPEELDYNGAIEAIVKQYGNFILNGEDEAYRELIGTLLKAMSFAH